MNAVYFIEKNGVKYYKCDTFWSKSNKIENAKIHNDSQYDQERFLYSLLDSLDQQLNYVRKTVDLFISDKVRALLEEFKNDPSDGVNESIVNFFQNTIYGYQTFKLSEVEGFSLKKDAKISDTIYLKYITNVSKEGYYDIIDYKQILRDEKINKIMGK